MSAACDYSVSVRIVASDGVTVVKEFNDRANGLTVETFQEPEENAEKARTSAPRVDGDFTLYESDAAGELMVVIRVEGDTWGQVVGRWQECRTAYRAESDYYLETEVEGVTTRYLTERPDRVESAGMESVNLYAKRQTYVVHWHVQPNPTVTIA